MVVGRIERSNVRVLSWSRSATDASRFIGTTIVGAYMPISGLTWFNNSTVLLSFILLRPCGSSRLQGMRREKDDDISDG